MEKSVKTYSSRNRVIPAALIVIGLLCASWLTIHTENETPSSAPERALSPADTTIKKKEKSARYSRKKVTATGEEGKPREEIVEEFEGDEALRPFMLPDVAAIPVIPAIPDIAFDIPAIADIPAVIDITEMHPLNGIYLGFDSIPYGMKREEWTKYNEELKKKFRERFGDFYKKHGEDLDKMLEEMSKDFERRFNTEEWHEWRDEAIARADIERLQSKLQALNVPLEKIQLAQKLQEEQVEKMELMREKLAELGKEQAERIEQIQQRMQTDIASKIKSSEDRARTYEEKAKAHEEKWKLYEKELQMQLVQDGYLKKGEPIENMEWDNDELKVNGKKVKDADRKKYQEIGAKYFPGRAIRFSAPE